MIALIVLPFCRGPNLCYEYLVKKIGAPSTPIADIPHALLYIFRQILVKIIYTVID